MNYKSCTMTSKSNGQQKLIFQLPRWNYVLNCLKILHMTNHVQLRTSIYYKHKPRLSWSLLCVVTPNRNNNNLDHLLFEHWTKPTNVHNTISWTLVLAKVMRESWIQTNTNYCMVLFSRTVFGGTPFETAHTTL